AVGLDVLVGFDAPDRHRQLQFNGIALLPRTPQTHVAVDRSNWKALTIHTELYLFPRFIRELVEVARHHLVPRPAGNSQLDGEPGFFDWAHPQMNLSPPRITGALCQLDFGSIGQFDFGSACHEKVHEDRVGLLSVNVPGNRRHEARDIAGAT